MATSPSQLPRSVPPNSDDEEEEVNLYVKIIKTVALKARRSSTVKHIKALIQDREHIDEHGQQLFFGGNCLEDGKRLVDYGIHAGPTLHLILQDSASVTVNVEISSSQKNLLVKLRLRDTVQNVKLMIQAKEGIRQDEFALVFGGKVLAEDRTLASLNLLPEPTFHLVFHPKDDVSVTVQMSNRRVTLAAKFWYTVRDVKAIGGALMSAQVMSLHMVYRGKLLEDHKTLVCYNIADGCVLKLVSHDAPFQRDWTGFRYSAPMAASPSQVPRSVPPNSDEEEEEVNLYLKITKTVVLKARRSSTVKHIKALIQDREHIDEHSQQLFFGGNCLEDGKRLVDYGIHAGPTLHLILQDSASVTVNVEISSSQKNLLVKLRLRDTVQNVKLMIQAKEGIRQDEFALVFGGKVLAEDRTLASLNLLPEPTFHLVFHPKDDVSVTVQMSNRRVTLAVKSWYTVRDVKAIGGALMSAQVMSLHMVYGGELLEDHKTLVCYNIADGSVLKLVSPDAPFQIFVKCSTGKTVVLQLCRYDTVKEVKNKLLHKLQLRVPAEFHHISYVGKRLADNSDLASYGIQENSTLIETILPR